jgi:excisionase family DNA binding protein
VAELLDVSAATVWRLIREGDLKVMRLRGGTTRVTDESLQRLVHGPQSPPKASMRRVVAARATP